MGYIAKGIFVMTLDKILGIPIKTISTWNKNDCDNYRLSLAVVVENLNLFYSFESYKKEYYSLPSSQKKTGLFPSLIRALESISQSLSDNGIVLVDISDSNFIVPPKVGTVLYRYLSIENILALNVWKYSGIFTKKSIERKREYLCVFLYILLLLDQGALQGDI